VSFRTAEDVLGPEGLAAADAAARRWARVWGRLPLLDGKSLRELVSWRGSSLLWSASSALRDGTAGPQCARTADIALRLLEATAPFEVDAHGLAPRETLLLARACTARGVLFHGGAPAAGRARGGRVLRGGLRRAFDAALAPGAPPPLPPPLAGAAGGLEPLVALVGGDDERAAIAPLVETLAAELRRAVVAVGLRELPRWLTRRARRAAGEAERLLQERLALLRDGPGLAASYSHRGVAFWDLAAGDLEALLLGPLAEAARRIEATVELLSSARVGAVVLAVPGHDERRSLAHACQAAGVGAVAVRLGPGEPGEEDRSDGGPQPLATVDWRPGAEASAVVARLREAVRGRVWAG
jgi:hypothetical protein